MTGVFFAESMVKYYKLLINCRGGAYLRLKQLEIHGFKSFADRTNFTFLPGVTAIVGPNGSGKSNIADALRWVMGNITSGTCAG